MQRDTDTRIFIHEIRTGEYSRPCCQTVLASKKTCIVRNHAKSQFSFLLRNVWGLESFWLIAIRIVFYNRNFIGNVVSLAYVIIHLTEQIPQWLSLAFAQEYLLISLTQFFLHVVLTFRAHCYDKKKHAAFSSLNSWDTGTPTLLWGCAKYVL